MVKDEQRIPSQIRGTSPCDGFTERVPACHDHCPKDNRCEFGYMAWKTEIDRVKANRKEYVRNLPKRKFYY